jgi:hypothetical protein
VDNYGRDVGRLVGCLITLTLILAALTLGLGILAIVLAR